MRAKPLEARRFGGSGTSIACRVAIAVVASSIAVAALVPPAGATEDGGETPPPDASGASLTIVLDAHDDQDFAFLAVGDGVSDFVLDDDGDPTLSNTQVLTGLSAGTYRVTQDAVPTWVLRDLSCTAPAAIDEDARTVTVDLAADDDVSCTFTNAPDYALVGAIRWDAWNDGPVGRYVEYTLGPEQWRSRLPWFAKVLGPDEVEIRADSQEIADAEILNAARLGLDYFAFLWYDPRGPEGSENETMSRGLRYYRSSAIRDLVKYTVIISRDNLADPPERADVLEFMRDPNWVRIDGRPLIFVGMAPFDSGALIDALRAESVAQGTGDPYIVYIAGGAKQIEAGAAYVDEYGFDAVSAYAINGGSASGDPYATLAARARDSWSYLADRDVPAVPTVMAGWDPRPRIERPPFWGDSGSGWYHQPTPDQLAAHLREANDWARVHGARATLVYAWNEYDEGGWLGPNLDPNEAKQAAVQAGLESRTRPTLAIKDAAVTEGDGGTVSSSFDVTLSSPFAQPVTVDYATVDGTAVEPDDYTATNGTLTLAPGETRATIEVDVQGDGEPEPDETFTVVIADPDNAIITRSEAVGTIRNDDGTVPSTFGFVSDLDPTSATNKVGPVERDMSNGGAAAGDGRPITLNGTVYAKGLGVHAGSVVKYALNEKYGMFLADVGVDDECGSRGTVVFRVLVDGEERFNSGVMSGVSQTQSVSVNATGGRQLVLRVTGAGDGTACDHADWAAARLGPPVPLPPTTTTTTEPTTTTSTVATTTTSVPDEPTSTTAPDEPATSTTSITTAPEPATTTSPTTTTPEPTTTTSTSTSTSSSTSTSTTTTTAPAEPESARYLSDLTPTSASNRWGPVELDMSNGNDGAGDGQPITLDGEVYDKGLGVHAASAVTYALGAGDDAFRAEVGVDDECGSLGSVVFQVRVDGTKRFDSGVMRGDTATQSVEVDVAGARELVLTVTDAGDGVACDHADWADARLTTPGPTPTSSPTTTTSTTTTTLPEPTTTTSSTTTSSTSTTSTTTTVPEPTTTSSSSTTTTTTTTPSGPEESVRALSDVAASAETNGYGPVERDGSNGGAAAGDGGTITLAGVGYPKGLGVHATSRITYPLADDDRSFRADVGVDDECGSSGSVVFEVLVDGTKRFDSGVMAGDSPTQSVDVDVAGAHELVLAVTDAGDGIACDHADWADARLVSTVATTTSDGDDPPGSSPPESFLSDLTPTSETNRFGPVEYDMSNGGKDAGDGGPIRLDGIVYEKGLGVHALSSVAYSLGGSSTTFRADVGVDDECGSSGSVVFQVFVDGTKRFDSGVMTGDSPTEAVVVDVSGADTLVLTVTDAGDGAACDHADWAAARVA